MIRYPSSQVIPLFRSACNGRYASMHILYAMIYLGVFVVPLIILACINKMNMGDTADTLTYYRQYLKHFIGLVVSLIIVTVVRYVLIIWDSTAMKIIYDASTQMIAITEANFCCGCCSTPTTIWDSHMNDIVIAAYNTQSQCCGSLYAVFLLTVSKNPECITAENPHGWQFFMTEPNCDESCYQQFITMVTSLKQSYGLEMEIIALHDYTQEQLGARFEEIMNRAKGKREGWNANVDFNGYNFDGKMQGIPV